MSRKLALPPLMVDANGEKTKTSHPETDRGHENSQPESGVRLKRRLSLVHGVAVICGLTIGSGIYTTPQNVLQLTGSPGEMLVVWTLGGLYGTIGALIYAELGTAFPQSGSRYHYLHLMYGPLVAFLELLTFTFFLRAASGAIKCLVFANHVLQPAFPDCLVTESGRRLVAVLLIGPLLFLNIFNVKWTATVQTVLTSISVLALTIIAAAGIFYIGTGRTDHMNNLFEGSSTNPGNICLAFFSITYSFAGWPIINAIVEELKDPYKNLPRALMISMFLVTVLYVLVNAAYVVVLGSEGMMLVDAVAVTFARKAFGVAGLVMPVLVALNMIGSYNAGSIMCSRVAFVAARKGELPEVLSYISVKYLTPITALICQVAITIPLALWFDMFSLLNNLVFADKLFEVLLIVGLIRHRYQNPEFHRPLKVHIVLVIGFLLACLAQIVIPLVYNPKESAIGGLVIICIGVPCYFVFNVWDNKPSGFRRMMTRINHVVQKLLLCVCQESPIDT